MYIIQTSRLLKRADPLHITIFFRKPDDDRQNMDMIVHYHFGTTLSNSRQYMNSAVFFEPVS